MIYARQALPRFLIGNIRAKKKNTEKIKLPFFPMINCVLRNSFHLYLSNILFLSFQVYRYFRL